MATNRDPLLDPDVIANRDFRHSRRGYDQNDVRRFLQQIAEAARADSGSNGANAEAQAALQGLATERDELRRRVAQLERAAATADNDDAIHVTSLITSETTQVIESARSAAAEIIRKAESEASRRRKEVKELEQRVDAEIQQKRGAVAEDTARVRRETQSEVTKLRNEADEETKSLRAKADDYASTTRAQAQEILRSRTAEAESFYETRTRKTEETTAAMRAEVEEETTTMRRNAEDASAKMRREAEEETLALRRRTDEEVKALRSNAEAAAEDLRTAAQARVDELNVEADKVRAESENAANIARAEASAAADLATREVRDEARMMVAEARAVREKILTDLVRRRRAARQQIDQARAARDRLMRSLGEVKRELEEATDELQRAVPDARAAMDRVPTPMADDDAEVAAAITSLDRSRPERSRSLAELGDEPETEDYARRIAGEDVAAPTADTAASARPDASGHSPYATDTEAPAEVDESVSEADEPADADHGDENTPESEGEFSDSDGSSANDEAELYTSASSEVSNPEAEQEMPPPPSPEDHIADGDDAPDHSTETARYAEAAAAVADFDYAAPGGQHVDETTASETHASDIDPPAEAESERHQLFDTAIGTDEQSTARSAGLFGLGAKANTPARGLFSATANDSVSVEAAAGTAVAAHGPNVENERAQNIGDLAADLKRQLKRALADDQSDLLDAVRRGGKDASIEDLPSRERQVARFADALETPLRSSANNGATAAGGKIWPGMVDGLVADTASRLVSDVRSAVDAAVSSDGGEDRSLEAIRGHYRDVRTNRLNRLVDSALNASFDLGVERASESAS